MRKKKYVTKYSKYGINKKEVRAIYERLRIKAYCILKNRHKQEYKKIMKELYGK
jgi:hypothetical protein